MSKLHDKLQKILALAERGEGGEKDTAQRMLEKLMIKYDITFAELGVNTKETYYWNYDSKHEKQILLQLVARVTNDLQLSYYTGDRKCGFDLTKSDYIEIDLHYSILRKDLKQLIDRLVNAFVQRNRLFANSPPMEKKREYTEKELDELEKMMAMASNINPSEVNQQLEKLT